MGSHLFSLASDLGGLFLRTLGRCPVVPTPLGSVSTRPELPTLALTSRRPPGSFVRAREPELAASRRRLFALCPSAAPGHRAQP